MKELDIGEVSRRTGVSASRLRFYETKGLVTPYRRHGLRRQYAPDILDRLALIALGQAAGFSLDEIGAMLASGGRTNINRKALLAKADELDEQVRRLVTMRDGLRHAAECPAPRHDECPTFRRLMKIAARRPSAAPKRFSR